MTHEWDALSEVFDVHKQGAGIDPKAADNILIAWPPMTEAIEGHFHGRSGLRALDYGCGTGGFTAKLASLGFEAIGMDNSSKMIDKARQTVGDNKTTNFIVGNADRILNLEPVDLMSAVMVFQLVKDIETNFQNLAKVITPDGMMVFAVHNPRYVSRCLEKEVLFRDFDSRQNPKQGNIDFGTAQVPIFIRTAQDYTDILQSLDFRKVLETYPPFTPEFIAQYHPDTPTEVSEYLVMGFVK